MTRRIRNTATYRVQYRDTKRGKVKVARVRAPSAREARAFYPNVVSVERIGR